MAILDTSTLARVDSIDLCKAATWVDGGGAARRLEAMLKSEVSTGFEVGVGAGVAWRVVILRSGRTMVLSRPHGTADGESEVQTMRTFLSVVLGSNTYPRRSRDYDVWGHAPQKGARDSLALEQTNAPTLDRLPDRPHGDGGEVQNSPNPPHKGGPKGSAPAEMQR